MIKEKQALAPGKSCVIDMHTKAHLAKSVPSGDTVKVTNTVTVDLDDKSEAKDPDGVFTDSASQKVKKL